MQKNYECSPVLLIRMLTLSPQQQNSPNLTEKAHLGDLEICGRVILE